MIEIAIKDQHKLLRKKREMNLVCPITGYEGHPPFVTIGIYDYKT
jgi:hypothetical protein